MAKFQAEEPRALASYFRAIRRNPRTLRTLESKRALVMWLHMSDELRLSALDALRAELEPGGPGNPRER